MRFFLLISTIFLTLAIETARRKAERSTPASQGSVPARTRLERFRGTRTYRRFAVRFFEAVLVLSAIGQGIVAFWGPFWPVTPEIHPEDTIDGSSLVLPLKITNKSIIPINAKMICGVDYVYAVDSMGTTVSVNSVAVITGENSLPPFQLRLYQCDASSVFETRPDGTLSPFGSTSQFVTQGGEPISWRPPFRILQMCIWVQGDYNVLGIIPWRFFHYVGEWPVSQYLHQWLEGPMVNRTFPFEQAPDHDFGMFSMWNNGHLRPNAPQCTGALGVYGLAEGKYAPPQARGQLKLVFPPHE